MQWKNKVDRCWWPVATKVDAIYQIFVPGKSRRMHIVTADSNMVFQVLMEFAKVWMRLIVLLIDSWWGRRRRRRCSGAQFDSPNPKQAVRQLMPLQSHWCLSCHSLVVDQSQNMSHQCLQCCVKNFTVLSSVLFDMRIIGSNGESVRPLHFHYRAQLILDFCCTHDEHALQPSYCPESMFLSTSSDASLFLLS